MKTSRSRHAEVGMGASSLRGPGDMEQEEVVFAVTALFILITLEDDPPEEDFFHSCHYIYILN